MVSRRSSCRFWKVVFTISLVFSFAICASVANAKAYRKATEGGAVVLKKLYPKKRRFEAGFDVGSILNQSYIQSYVLHFSGTYFMNETWGFGADLIYSINSDKDERYCIESFYNDPDEQVPAECAVAGDETVDLYDQNGQRNKANMGPAYVPIREIQFLIAGNAYWNPVYGKQLFLLSSTSYFDLFVSFGGGIAMSKYYPQETYLRNGKSARGSFDENNKENNPGAEPDEADEYGLLWGEEGRPEPANKINPLICGSIGQRYHFAKRFVARLEFKNYMLVATERGFESFFTLFGGVGVRF